mgnify:CR=1 FL=1
MVNEMNRVNENIESMTQFKQGQTEILRVTSEGVFIWCDDADNVISNGDFSNSPSLKHILLALREREFLLAGMGGQR